MREWRKNSFRDFLRRLLFVGESPHRTALAFAVGVFLAFSPLWGLHTTLGLLLAFLFRLNRVAVLVGVWTNTPWTGAPVASLGTALGVLLLGTDVRLPDIPEGSLLSLQFWLGTWSAVQHLFWPFLVGNTALSALVAVVAYYLFRWVLIRNARRRSGAGEP